MGNSAPQKYSDWQQDYFFLDLVPILWHHWSHFLMSSFVPCWHSQTWHFIHTYCICRVRSCDMFGDNTRIPLSGCWYPAANQFFIRTATKEQESWLWHCSIGLRAAAGRKHLVHMQWARVSRGMCIIAMPFKAGSQHNWLPLSLFRFPVSLTPSDDLEYKTIFSLVLFISRSYEISNMNRTPSSLYLKLSLRICIKCTDFKFKGNLFWMLMCQIHDNHNQKRLSLN